MNEEPLNFHFCHSVILNNCDLIFRDLIDLSSLENFQI